MMSFMKNREMRRNLGLTDEGIFKQSGYTESEIKDNLSHSLFYRIIKDIALQKVHRQKSLKDF